MGTKRAAWPIPQFRGLNKMRFVLIIFKIWFYKLKTLQRFTAIKIKKVGKI
jgi:hypothetical protein